MMGEALPEAAPQETMLDKCEASLYFADTFRNQRLFLNHVIAS